MAPIAVGDKLPDGKLVYMDEDGSPKVVTAHSLAAGKKIVLVGAPGAFTSTCSLKHIPSVLDKADEIIAKGVDSILCVTVNDVFVVNEWSKTYKDRKGAQHVKFLADGSAGFAKALGLDIDLSKLGMGIRSSRFALLVDDLEVKFAHLENGGEFTMTGVEDILKALDQ